MPEQVPANVEITFSEPAPVYASSVQVASFGNDFGIMFAVPRPGEGVIDGKRIGLAQNRPVASVLVSPLTMKDLALVATKAVAQYEAIYGPIVTDFSRAQESNPA